MSQTPASGHDACLLFLPFVIGATSFDLRYGQGFYGWIGDVRITGRPLKPAQFLTNDHRPGGPA